MLTCDYDHLEVVELAFGALRIRRATGLLLWTQVDATSDAASGLSRIVRRLLQVDTISTTGHQRPTPLPRPHQRVVEGAVAPYSLGAAVNLPDHTGRRPVPCGHLRIPRVLS